MKVSVRHVWQVLGFPGWYRGAPVKALIFRKLSLKCILIGDAFSLSNAISRWNRLKICFSVK